MDLRPGADGEALRTEIREFLDDGLSGRFSVLRGRGGPGDEQSLVTERHEWERHLGRHGWTAVGWPGAHGGRGLSLSDQVIVHEEYARARGPGRLGHIGETLVGPTLIEFGSPSQQARHLPTIASAEELWCQGYSEPDAGSDLANLATTAHLDGDEWVVTGQKVWTSLAHLADWCLLLARTDSAAPRHLGISCLLVPMRQPGVEVRPIVQMTGGSEFNEVFFDGARTDSANVVGEVGGGWKVAMGTLAYERGASTLGQVLSFQNELAEIVDVARRRGLSSQPVVRDRIAAIWSRLSIMRWHAIRTASAVAGEHARATSVGKLYWATLHRDMGELAMSVMGAEGLVYPSGEIGALQRMFLFSRSDTIYAGTNQIQRNVIGERALGLAKEPAMASEIGQP